MISCLEGNCTSAEPCLMQCTICNHNNLFSTKHYITFEEWVTQDITDNYDPLRQEHEHVEIHGFPLPIEKFKTNQTHLEKSNITRYVLLLYFCFALFLCFIVMFRYKTTVLAASIQPAHGSWRQSNEKI